MLVIEPTSVNSRPTSSSSANSMLTPGGSQQYIQPDYLSPLPTTLDAKRSPLALLAQTCSQIGADPAPAASAGGKISAEKNGSSIAKKESSSTESGKSSKTPPASVMKHERREESTKPSEESHTSVTKSGFKSPGVHSSSTSGKSGSHHHHHGHRTSSSPTSSANSITSSAPEPTRTATDTAKLLESHRAALDALQGLPKDIPLGTYRSHFPPMSGLPSYGGIDAATAAALGLGVPGAFRHPYPPMGGIPGYPPVSLGLGLAGYQALNYGRMKTAGSESLMSGMPVCRDPYCTGCPSSMLAMASASPGSIPAAAATPSAAAGVCPAGCTQCDHQKLAGGIPSSSTTTTTPTSTSPFSPSSGSNTARPYVCNWIAGDNYCGKRFTSSEELLQHLRTHTSLAVPAGSDSPAVSSAYSSLLNPALHPHSHLLASSSAMHRTYPTPPLSPLSMARYHPYSKAQSASALPSPLSTPPNPMGNPLLSLSSQSQLGSLNPLAALSGHNHLSAYAVAAANTPLASHPTLGAYYSHPYSLYSQRLGAGVLP